MYYIQTIIASVKKIHIILDKLHKNIRLPNYFTDMKLLFIALKDAKKIEKYM